jgi:hypothetical protein
MAIDNISGTGDKSHLYQDTDTSGIDKTRPKTNDSVLSLDAPITSEGSLGGAGSSADGMGLAAPKLSGSDLMVMLNTMRSKLQQTRMKTSSEDIKNIQDQKANAAKERIKQLQENIKKMHKSKKSGTFGKIFGWIAAAAMVIAGAALTLAGGAGTALLVGGITMMAVMTLQQTGAMDKAIGGIAKGLQNLGLSEHAAQIVATAIMAAVVVAASAGAGAAAGPAVGVMVGAQLATTLISPDNLEKMGIPEKDAPWVSMGLSIGFSLAAIGVGIGTAASSTAQAGGKLGALFAKLSESTPEQLARVSRFVSIGAQTMNAAATVGAGAAGVGQSVLQKDAANAEADAKELQKDMLKLQQMLQDESDRIKEIMKELQESTDVVMGVLNQADTTHRRITTV